MDDSQLATISQLVERLEQSAPSDDPKVRAYLTTLKTELRKETERQEVRDAQLREYAEAYEKLTAPANRLGLFLEHLEDGLVLIASGDTDFVSMVDPKVDPEHLVPGARVRMNEAYAVVGVMPPHTGGGIVKVSEVLPDGRLRVSADPQGNAGRIAWRGADLEGVRIDRGDEVRVEPLGRVALEHFARQEVQDYFVEDVPEIPWERIGGQEAAISLIRDTIEHPLLYPELYQRFDKRPVKGILLYGPPGCGKTLIGKATAYNLAKDYSARVGHEVKEYFMHISGPKILNMWLGETERMVREIFDTARARAKEGRLVVIFMDEAESVLRTRSSGRWLNISNTVVPQFCAEMDGLVALENVVLILTSNRPDYIDPAVLRPERIDRKVKVNRPDRDASREILSIYLLDRLPLDPALLAEHDGEAECARRALLEAGMTYLWRADRDTEFLNVFLRNGERKTLYYRDLVSGALLKSVVDRAKELAIRRAIDAPEASHGIGLQDLRTAIDDEYRENEIFPKSDVMEDWLKLIDLEPESVATVKPVRESRGESFLRKNVI